MYLLKLKPMKMYVSGLCALALTSCLSSKVLPSTEDASFACFQNNGQIQLFSLNSAIQTKIIRQQQIGDTLFVTYRKGAFLTPNSMVPVTAQISYLKCAGRLHKVAEIPVYSPTGPISR